MELVEAPPEELQDALESGNQVILFGLGKKKNRLLP